jgi:eukaryotic-like serine/threonine-protein kinase
MIDAPVTSLAPDELPPDRGEAIFHGALQLPEAQRADYVTQACGGDAQLRQQVEALLKAHAAAGGFLEEPLPPSPNKTIALTLPLTEKPGDRIGRYKLLQQIGEGGCGVVYMAEQEQPVRRRVALKVIKLGMDTRQVVARFEAERQALALMDHPNIAKVLDAGATDTGRPYFVMELVRGIKITEYCDQNKLTATERLKLFVQVCHALQHAHQKGIIHRDIKPSNILVTVNDGVPVPKVIDFGIAKATDQRLTDKTLFTAFEQFIGTPAYMSPEQAVMTSLDIDTRTDIYSLGVLLYELLTGQTPFDAKKLLAAGLDHLRQIIREQEPERPSTRLRTMVNAELTLTASHYRTDAPRLIHLLSGDLDWIVMKALEKDRTRRYETANGLAMDVQRFLYNEPVAARPPSNLYRLQKLVRRNKATFAGIGAVSLALILGFIVSLYLFAQERQARRRAVAAEQEQARLRQAAERTAYLETQMRLQAESDAKYARMRELLNKGDFDGAEQLLNQVPQQFLAAPFLNVIGRDHAQHGRWLPALTNFSRAAMVASQTNSGWRDLLPGVYHALAPLLLETGDIEGYRQHCARALREFADTTEPTTAEPVAKDSLILPPPTEAIPTIDRMVNTALAAGPEHKTWPYCQFLKGLFEYRQGHYAEAIDWLQKVTPYQGDPYLPVHSRMILAMAQHQLQLEPARATLTEGLQLAEKLDKTIENQPRWGDWIIAQILIREAEKLVGTNQPQPQH